MLKKYVTLILFVLFVFISSSAEAHRCNGTHPHRPDGSHFGPCNPQPLPIDGGVGILLVLGIGYAASKLKDKE